MKNRSLLMLVEMTVMLFVFALAAAFCLQGFASARTVSQNSAARDEACLIAQNVVQVLQFYGGDAEMAAQSVRFQTEQGGYTLQILPLETDTPLLGMAEITVYKNETALFSLTASWQEVADYE